MAKKQSGYFHLHPSEKQKGVVNFLRSNMISIIEGEAGTGKDFCCLFYALDEIRNGSKGFDKIVITKPVVEVGKSMGFLPGPEQEKTDVYSQSFGDNLIKMVGIEEARKITNAKKLEFSPINFCRGNTIDNAIVILSEAQNCTLHELVTFTTRISDSSRLLVNGDILQADIRNSGFKKYIELFGQVEDIGYLCLDESYQMRSPLIVHINRIYRQYLKDNG